MAIQFHLNKLDVLSLFSVSVASTLLTFFFFVFPILSVNFLQQRERVSHHQARSNERRWTQIIDAALITNAGANQRRCRKVLLIWYSVLEFEYLVMVFAYK